MRTLLLRLSSSLLLAVVTVVQPLAAPAESGDTIIVVDASGSMWSQVDGVSKIKIARGVFADLLGDWPEDRQLGVIAYGHRRKGDCKLATALERAGVAFTAHVVGFDVTAKDQPKIACIAENTGGRFVSADTAVQLGDAMRTVTVEPKPEPATVQITLKAINADTRTELPEAVWSVTAADNDTRAGTGSPLKLELVAGTYSLTVRAGDAEVNEQLTVIGGRPTTHEILLSMPLPAASLEAPAEIPAGSAFQVHWTGPDDDRDFVTIVEVGTPEGEYQAYADTRHGTPAKLTAPDALGAHELRYVHGASKRTLASLNVTLTPIEATLDVKNEAAAGSQIEVLWTGPDNFRDYIAIAEPGAPEGSYTNYRNTRHGSPAKLQLPDALGKYEIRYVIGQSKRTLASAPVTLVPVTASLIVEGPVVPGAKLDVQWQGPDNRGDYITIVEQGAPEGSHTHYRGTNHGSPLQIRTPEEPGDYEVRYVVGQSKRTLASVPVRVDNTSVSLSVAATTPLTVE